MSEELEFRPCKALLVIWLILTPLPGLVLGAILAGALSEQSATAALMGFIGGAVPTMAVVATGTALYFFSINYNLDDRYIVKSHGVLWKARRSIPLEKITNIDVRQGPLERILGFGRVWIFTPSTGGMMPEEKLIGVTDPNQLKRILTERVDALKGGVANEGLAARPAAADAPAAGGETVELLRDISSTLKRIESGLAGQTSPQAPPEPGGESRPDDAGRATDSAPTT